ncbi:MAG: D-alanine--D-alanine ligase [Gammaproteobacteria bacterium]|nr:D-alanine--D-alanine ligase [Gammaproteobacteria bacterium]
MRIGIAYDLKRDQTLREHAPDDALEEYDSEDTIEAIAAALRAAGHAVLRLGGGRAFVERVLAASAGRSEIDLVFNIAEGRGSRSREAHIPAVCELLGLRITHSDPQTLAICLDKALTKRIAASHGIATPSFCVISTLAELATAPLPPLPVVVKPNDEGSSIGIRDGALCTTAAQVGDQVEALLRDYHGAVLVEAFLPGAEVTAAVLGNGRAVRVAALMEIAPSAQCDEPFLYSLKAKRNYLEAVRYHQPPRLPRATLAAIEHTALRAYHALGCRDLARIDLRLDAGGGPGLIEINPIPGLNPTIGDLPLACARAGLAYEQLIAGIVADASQRSAPAT